MPTAATLALRHGKIITVDRAFAIAEAGAIAGETILHVGRSAEMQPCSGPETRVMDLRGACVIPGLIDAHAHMDRQGLRDLIDWGIPVTIETGGSPIDLLHALWVLMARRERETGELIAAHQHVSRRELLRTATINGAYLTFEEGKKGSIEPGKWADLVVLEDDLLTLPEDRIKDRAIRLTVVGGRLVYEAAPTPRR